METQSTKKVSTSCQVDIPNFSIYENTRSPSPLADYIPHIIRRLKKLKPETERSKLFNEKRAMASVGKKTSRERNFHSLKKTKGSILPGKQAEATNTFVDFVDSQTFIKKVRNKQEIFRESQFFLPKIPDSKLSGSVLKKGKLGPLIHSPFREVLPEDPEKRIRKYSYFHIRNFSVRDSSIEC
jgi:hypothetical protein